MRLIFSTPRANFYGPDFPVFFFHPFKEKQNSSNHRKTFSSVAENTLTDMDDEEVLVMLPFIDLIQHISN